MKRHKKYVPAIGYAIVWFDIEDPNEFHSNLIRAWNQKSHYRDECDKTPC